MILAENPTAFVLIAIARHCEKTNYYTASQVYEWVKEDNPDEVEWLSMVTLGKLLSALGFHKGSLHGRKRYFISPSNPELLKVKSDLGSV